MNLCRICDNETDKSYCDECEKKMIKPYIPTKDIDDHWSEYVNGNREYMIWDVKKVLDNLVTDFINDHEIDASEFDTAHAHFMRRITNQLRDDL